MREALQWTRMLISMVQIMEDWHWYCSEHDYDMHGVVVLFCPLLVA
jgi:hypothetical protein